MAFIKTVSQTGLESVFCHEGTVQGIYNCPAGHATFGMGTLVHSGPSKLLDAVRKSIKEKHVPSGGTPDLSAYLKTFQKSKKSAGLEYLSVEIGSDKTYKSFVGALLEALSARRDENGKKLVEKESKYLEKGWETYLTDFRSSISVYEKAICDAFPNTLLTQRQFDGFFSLAYNIGPSGLKQNKSLINAMNRFSAVMSTNELSAEEKNEATSALLDQILRAKPNAPGPVSGDVDKVSFTLTESGVFNSGLFNRRIAEASMIIGHEYSAKDDEIKIGRKTIKGEKDHQTTETAKKQVRTIIDGLNAINRINTGL